MTDRVLRCSSSDCILIDGIPFRLSDLVGKVNERLIYGTTVCSNGRVFNSYHHAPIFYSGSPYADFLKSVIDRMENIPENFSAEYLPQDGIRPAMCSVKWAELLGLDWRLHWFATE